MTEWIKVLWCKLMHAKYTIASPVYHSWNHYCSKCGRRYVVKD